MRLVTVFLAAAMLATPLAALDAETKELGWADLVPAMEPYHDPFADMEFDQLTRMANLYRIEILQADIADDAMRQEAADLRAALKEDGLDADWLFEQREIVMAKRRFAMTTPNTDLIGQSVRLPGYLLPLETEGEKVVEFLLVPTVGACIHVPPPPANQIVHVEYPEGFEAIGLFTPVWISGQIEASQEVHSLWLVDGRSDVSVSYTMNASGVEAYQ